MKKIFKSKLLIQIVVSSMVATIATAGIVAAATTIGSDINTGGTLTATGATTLSSTLGVTGLTTLSNNITVPNGYGLDAVSGTLNLGTTTATIINVGSTGATTAIRGNLTIPGAYSLDANGILNIGTTTATTINVGRSNQVVAQLGNSTVAGTLGVTGLTTLSNATTTQATITTLWLTDVHGFTLQEAITGNSKSITGLSQLTVTGTTATSTFSTGGLIVATDKFIIEQSSGKLGIGTSTPANFISGHLSSTVAITFGAVSGNTCSDQPMTVIGAVDGNTVVLGIPNELATASTTLVFTGFVSAADTVKVRMCKTDSAAGTFVAATIRADVWKH